MVWRPGWLGGSDETDPDKVAAAKKDKEEFDKTVAEAVKKQTDPILAKLAGLDSLTAFVSKSEKESKDRADAEAAEVERKRKEAENKNQPTDEDIAALMLTDPKRAVGLITKNQTELLLKTTANQAKSSVFSERADEFPYYAGDVKIEVDKILSEQSLQFQNDPTAIANTYYTVVGKKQKEISEGKIKSRFASASTSSGGSGKGGEGGDSEINIDVTDDMRKAARMSGMEIDDYMKLVKAQVKSGQMEMV